LAWFSIGRIGLCNNVACLLVAVGDCSDERVGELAMMSIVVMCIKGRARDGPMTMMGDDV